VVDYDETCLCIEILCFYPHDAMLAHSLCDSDVSVCLSVCPSLRTEKTALK